MKFHGSDWSKNRRLRNETVISRPAIFFLEHWLQQTREYWGQWHSAAKLQIYLYDSNNKLELTATHPSWIHCSDRSDLKASSLLGRAVKQQYIYSTLSTYIKYKNHKNTACLLHLGKISSFEDIFFPPCYLLLEIKHWFWPLFYTF